MIDIAQTSAKASNSDATRHSQLGAHYTALWGRLRRHEQASSRSLRTIGVLSCGRGEGVSTVAANLAISATWDDEGSILLLDAQVNSPDIPTAFHVPAAPGWIDAALKGSSPQEYLRPSARAQNLFVAACGGRRRRGAGLPVRELLSVIESVRPDFGRTIVDLPPWSECGTSLTALGGLDGVVLVVEAERVHRQSVERVVRQLGAAGIEVLGIVFNKCEQSLSHSLDLQV